MTLYRYRALSPTGELAVGQDEADAPAEIIARLQAQGLIPIDANEYRPNALQRWLATDLFGQRLVPHRDAGLVAHQLATLIEAGLPLVRALETVIEALDRARLRKLLQAMLDRVRAGDSLAAATQAQQAFSPAFVSMIRAGEMSGALAPALVRLADLSTRAHELRETVKSALVYPVILLIVAGLSICFILGFVLPEFKPLFDSAPTALPTSTRLLMGAGEAIQRHWQLLLAGLAALGFAIHQLARSPRLKPTWHLLALRTPLLRRLVLAGETARLTRTLGTLVTGGVPLSTALPITRETLNNLVIRAAVARATDRLKEGEGLSRPLARLGRFPRLAIQLIRVGEETGRLGDMLLECADIYDGELRRTIDRALALLVPCLTIGLGFVVAGIIASVLVAILSINNLVS
jgi:general secretion pathway protein F